MSTPPREPRGESSDSPAGGSPRTPRGGLLRDRVSFFERMLTSQNRSVSTEDLERAESPNRASDSSFEESFERLVEEGELNGAKVVKFEKITVRKSVREVTSVSRSPSVEQGLEDSAYQSHGILGSHGSKSSSVTSFARFPSEESLEQRSGEERGAAEWYAEFHNQSFQNVSARMEYVRSRSEYDAHILEIKGIGEGISLKIPSRSLHQ